jgi:crossover junction endodeoxyribonuclease RusA
MPVTKMKPRTPLPAPRRYADGSLMIPLPIPARSVSPNASRGESKGSALRKSVATRKHRSAARLLTIAALAKHGNGVWGGYRLRFFWPTARQRDDDNADASCKAYRDGVAEALGIDDKLLRKVAISTHDKDAEAPRVEFILMPADAGPSEEEEEVWTGGETLAAALEAAGELLAHAELLEKRAATLRRDAATRMAQVAAECRGITNRHEDGATA